jgi:hypothetical protein
MVLALPCPALPSLPSLPPRAGAHGAGDPEQPPASLGAPWRPLAPPVPPAGGGARHHGPAAAGRAQGEGGRRGLLAPVPRLEGRRPHFGHPATQSNAED